MSVCVCVCEAYSLVVIVTSEWYPHVMLHLILFTINLSRKILSFEVNSCYFYPISHFPTYDNNITSLSRVIIVFLVIQVPRKTAK